MADTLATKATLDGLHKVVYEDSLENLPYENFVAQRDFKFRSTKKVGKNFQFPLVVSMEQGYAYCGPNTTITLPDSVPNAVVMATVSPYQGLLKSVMNFEVAHSAAGGPESFRNATQFLFESMMFSHRKRKEINGWYGQKELATVASIVAKVITITTAEWAPGIWAGMEGAVVRIADAGLTLWRTNVATTDNTFKITAVDLDLRKITVEGVTTGDQPNAVVSTDRIFFNTELTVTGGVGTFNEANGVFSILGNAGSLWGVNAAAYSMWKSGSKVINPAANLSLDNIFEATALGAARGMDGDSTLYLNVQTWRKLLTNQAALRQYDVSYSEKALKQGAMELQFFAQTGLVKLVGSVYIKEGYAALLQPKKWFRVGSTDITFRLPGLQDQMFDLDSTYGGFRVQTYDNQALVTTNPGHAVLISGILNS